MRQFILEVLHQQHPHNKDEDFVYTEVATEGIATAMVADIGHSLHNTASSIMGWLEGATKKRTHINDIAISTIEWLKEEKASNKKLELDMGAFKTWMKTSETYLYRYYYLLADSVYNEMVSNLKKGDISELENFFSHFTDQLNATQTLSSADMKDRRTATRMLDSLRTIDDVIVVVEKYRARCNVIFDLLQKQERSIKGFPFQLMLRGMNDLRQTAKKLVNLAT